MPATQRTRATRIGDILFLLLGVALLFVLTTVYLMPFRLDDVLHIDWAHSHTFWDAFDPIRGEIVRSYRPLFAATIWLLTHYAGLNNYFPWHLTLAASFFIGLAFTGLTVRYISGQASSLYISMLLFWIAFLPILNVLFWFGDLTFTIELMFTASAWYYGIRGMQEGRIGMWFTACLLGVCAVLSKEPALLLVHSVFVGVFILARKKIVSVWKQQSRAKGIFTIVCYIGFIVISLLLFFSSPTKSNRFFHFELFTTEQTHFFIWDRIRYYSESLLNPAARILLVAPILCALFSAIMSRIVSSLNLALYAALLILAAIISFFFVKSIITLSVLLLVIPFFLYYLDPQRKKKYLFLLPFSITAVITLAVLEITVMLVKTQLTELALVLLVISGVLWGDVIHEFGRLFRLQFTSRKAIRVIIGIAGVSICVILFTAFPLFKSKLSLLSEVRDTRYNANDAIKWMALNVPNDATILVTGPALFHITRADDMTSKEDEFKSYGQYTFLQGYVRFYLENLGRKDLHIAYLEDPITLERVLDSFRETTNTYLFLQTGLEGDTFHGVKSGRSILTRQDSLVVTFSQGKYPSEVWKL